MQKHPALALGLGVATLGYLYVVPYFLAFSTLDAVLLGARGLGLAVAAAAAYGGAPRALGAGAGTAALASLPNLRILLGGSVSVRFAAGLLEPLGLVVLAAPLVRRGLASSVRDPDGGGPDGDGAARTVRTGLAIAAASSLLYGVANLQGGNSALLPGNSLAFVGFALAARRVRGPLFGEEAGDPSDG